MIPLHTSSINLFLFAEADYELDSLLIYEERYPLAYPILLLGKGRGQNENYHNNEKEEKDTNGKIKHSLEKVPFSSFEAFELWVKLSIANRFYFFDIEQTLDKTNSLKDLNGII